MATHLMTQASSGSYRKLLEADSDLLSALVEVCKAFHQSGWKGLRIIRG